MNMMHRRKPLSNMFCRLKCIEKRCSIIETSFITGTRKNQTWSKVDLPKGRTAIGSKLVFKLKSNENGGVERYKARLVHKAFPEYMDEISASVARSPVCC